MRLYRFRYELTQPIREEKNLGWEERGLNMSLKCRKFFLSRPNIRTQQFWTVFCVLYFLVLFSLSQFYSGSKSSCSPLPPFWQNLGTSGMASAYPQVINIYLGFSLKGTILLIREIERNDTESSESFCKYTLSIQYIFQIFKERL